MSGADALRVVVGVDLRPGSTQPLLTFAADEANRRGAHVELVHGLDVRRAGGAIAPIPPLAQREEQASRRLAMMAEQLREHLVAGLGVDTQITVDTGPALLLKASRRAALIVLQRRDITRAGHVSTGSTSSTVAARAECSVAVVSVTTPTVPTGAPVVVGVDDAGHAQQALEAAFEEASLRHASLLAVHVWSSQDALLGYGWASYSVEQLEERREKADLALAEALAGFGPQYPDVTVRRRVVDATVAEGLLSAAQDAALLVIGRHGHSRLGSLALGGVARRCLDAAPCPVVVTPTSRVSSQPSWLTQDVTMGPSF